MRGSSFNHSINHYIWSFGVAEG